MSGESMKPETRYMSFEELGSAIAVYEAAELQHLLATTTNRIHDDEDYGTISGQDREDWKQKHPRFDDDEATRRQQEHEAAKQHLVSTLGLESEDIIPALRVAYHDEQVRQKLQDACGENPASPWRTAITALPGNREACDMIAGAVTMARLTGESYTVHSGIIRGGTYEYAYADVEPVHEVDDVVAQFLEQGLDVTGEAQPAT